MKKLSLIILFGLSLTLPAIAQQQITLDLQRTITMANDSSLEAFRTKICTCPVIGRTALIKQTVCRA
mgnify:CR=1 FL=1